MAGAGFEPGYFAEMLSRFGPYDDADFFRYEITPDQLAAVRVKIAQWHRQLTTR